MQTPFSCVSTQEDVSSQVSPPGVPPGSEAEWTPAKTSSGGTAVEDGRRGKTRSQRTNEAKTNEPLQGLGGGGWRSSPR